jgi:hypothetical protein
MEFILLFIKFLLIAGCLYAIVLTVRIIFELEKNFGVRRARNLVGPFEHYLEQVQKEVNDSEIPELQQIVDALRNGHVPKSIRNYDIERDYIVVTLNESGNRAFKLKRQYTVFGKLKK